MIAEVATRYGYPPETATWHEVVGLAARTDRFDIRDRLILADGTALGQPLMDEAAVGQRMMMREKLNRLAWGP